MAYSWQKLADNWSSLTEQQKHEMFKNTKYLKPSVEEMKELGKFKIVSEDKLNVKVLPLTLISISATFLSSLYIIFEPDTEGVPFSTSNDVLFVSVVFLFFTVIVCLSGVIPINL